MGSMEKKRLLPALTGIFLAALAVFSFAEDPPSLEGVRTEPEEKDIVSAREFIKTLGKPDAAAAEKILSETRKNPYTKNQKENAAEFLSAKTDSPPSPEENAAPADGGTRLFYFFSFSMPLSALRDVAEEIASAGGVMVLRGLAGDDFRETVLRIAEVAGKSPAEIWIEPSLFECFGVDAVPQLALSRNFAEGGDCGSADYVKVSGDVSVSYALGIMQKEDADAGTFIGRMRKGGFYGD